MTEKQTYWLADRAGNKALVEGAAERDRWVPLGWAEADEPTGDELVWASFEGVEDPAQFPAEVFLEVWGPKGWTPSAPPEPVDPLTGIRPPRPVPATPPAAAPAETTVQGKTAAGGEKETKTRG
jgi:hypothetical protein